MSNDELPPNPNPIVHLEGKRFGEEGGGDPREAQAKSREKMKENASVRRMVRRIAEHEFDFGDGAKPIPDQIKDVFGSRRMTGAQVLAAARFAQGMKNYKAMQGLVEDIDGKLIEKKAEAKVGYAELVSGSLDMERDGEDDTLVTGN